MSKKTLLIGDFVTTDDEALAFVIMDNCIEKWNFKYSIRRSKILKKIDEIVIERNRNSGDRSNTTRPDPTVISLDRSRRWNQPDNTLETPNDDGEERELVRTKKDMEHLKGILQKELITNEDKNSLPISKYTEQ